MMQGDSGFYGIQILNNAGNPVIPEDVRDIEVTIGHLIKKYSNAELIYTNGWWLFPISQEETFEMKPLQTKSQVRVAWANGVVEGMPLYGVHPYESLSKEVL